MRKKMISRQKKTRKQCRVHLREGSLLTTRGQVGNIEEKEICAEILHKEPRSQLLPWAEHIAWTSGDRGKRSKQQKELGFISEEHLGGMSTYQALIADKQLSDKTHGNELNPILALMSCQVCLFPIVMTPWNQFHDQLASQFLSTKMGMLTTGSGAIQVCDKPHI